MEFAKSYLKYFSLFVLGASSLGCSGSDQLERGEVTGMVTLDGKPLDSGRIIFRPVKGRAGRGEVRDGKIISTGTYDMDDGIVLGTHKIAVQPIVKDAPITIDRMAEEVDDEKPKKRRSRVEKPSYAALPSTNVKIPRRYHNPDTSGFTKEIVAGENTLELKLTSQ
ncbi:MAG: hypothetical protein RH917_15770 [Lacipirellulaceae bacterium]